MTSAVTPRADVERVLVLTAHPDDVDHGAGGTVATWTRAGIEVRYVIATSGDAGGFDDDFPRAEMAALREREQRDAAAAGGVTDVTFLHYPDGQLYPTLELRRDISREIRRFRPQRVLTQSPEIWWRRLPASPPDPRATGGAAPPLAPGPPRDRGGPSRRRLPRCAQPVRPSGAARRRGPGIVGRQRALAHGCARRAHRSRRRHHRHHWAQSRGSSRAREPDRPPARPRPTNPQPGRYVGPPLRTDRRAHRRGVPDRVDRLTVGDPR